MPVSQSAKKALRRDRRRRVINLKISGALKKQVSAFRKKPTKASWPKVVSAIDRARKARVIHANRAARLKSRLGALLGK